MIVTTAPLCKAAYGKFAIGACNITNDGQATGLFRGRLGTGVRLVWSRVHREFFRDKPRDFDFLPPGRIFMDECPKFIAHRNGKLGSAGTLPEIRKVAGI